MDSPLTLNYFRDILIYINKYLSHTPLSTSNHLTHHPRIAKTVYPPGYNPISRNYNDFQQHIISELHKSNQ